MPSCCSLKTRLTLLNTIILVLILGAGGFFLYSSQQRQLLDQVDADLLSIAKEISCNYYFSDETGNQQKTACKALEQVARTRIDNFSATLYSIQGEQLCSNNNSQLDQLEFQPHSLNHELYLLDSTTVNNRQIRHLQYSISVDEKLALQLQVGKPLDQLTESSYLFALLLLASGIVITICFSASHWFLLGMLTKPLNKLSRLMDQTDEDNLPQLFTPPKHCGKELHQLTEGYNSLSERLALSLRKAQQFSADVTHELRTPLTILRGETELALRGKKTKEQLTQSLCSNHEEICRMGHLIDDLLLLSKSELGEIPLKMEAINLGTLLEELHFQANIIAEEKQIQVHLHCNDEKISLLADPPRIRQVFLNLLSNAIKYTPEGGSVTINWSLQNDFARIIIEDTGIGIDNK